MKRIILATALLLIFCNLLFAGEFIADQPFLITSAGQSADVLMAKILSKKAALNFSMDKLAKPEALKNISTLIIVSGGSTKGLGAAKIDKDQELKRINSLIKQAKVLKIKIITMHMGGKARRGKLSDEFNTVAANKADCLIVVNSGNDDQFFSNIAKEKNIPIFLIDKTLEAGNVLKKIFSNKPE